MFQDTLPEEVSLRVRVTPGGDQFLERTYALYNEIGQEFPARIVVTVSEGFRAEVCLLEQAGSGRSCKEEKRTVTVKTKPRVALVYVRIIPEEAGHTLLSRGRLPTAQVNISVVRPEPVLVQVGE